MKPYLARVTWLDAHQVFDCWQELGELDPDPCQVESVGWVLPGVKKGHLVLAQSVARKRDHYDSGLAIPKKMVLKVEKLTPPAS